MSEGERANRSLPRRLFGLLLVLALVGGVLWWVRGPVDAPLIVRLGRAGQRARELDLHFQRDGAIVRDLALRFDGGASDEVRRTIRLRRGTYEVAIRLAWDDGREAHISRPFRATDEGDVIDLASLR